MGFKVKRTGAAEYGQHVKALVCGNPGAGKTLISSTFPNPLYASAEGGLMSLARRNIPYVDVKEINDLLAVKAMCEQAPHVRKELLGFEVDTVVVDTIDEIQKILIRERLKENRKDSMELRDWGWLGDQMQVIISGFRNLDMNVVMTCHLREQQDSEAGTIWFEPGLQGAIGKQIAAYFDLALLLDVRTISKIKDGKSHKEQVRYLISSPDSKHQWIKDRSGQLDPEMVVNFEDDFKRIAEKIYGGIELPESVEEEVVAPVANTVKQAVDNLESTVQDAPQPSAPEPEGEGMFAAEPVEEAPVEPVETPVEISTPEPEAQPEVVEEKKTCVTCGAEVDSKQADLSRIRFRKILCRDDFMAEKRR